MIKVENIRKHFGPLQVLKGVNAEIKKGEVVSVVGASGAGKTTLLHIMGTLDRADGGKVVIDDVDVAKLSDKELSAFRNSNIGFVFQFHHLLPEFDALENVCIPGYIGRRPGSIVVEKAKQLLEMLGLSERLGHKPGQLSGGEQQRVAVARSLINDPLVVLADEPSGNLDSETSKELHKMFFQLRENLNQTFVIVTHNQELAVMADRILTMKDGLILD